MLRSPAKLMICLTLIANGAQAAPKLTEPQGAAVGLTYLLLGTARICRTVLGPDAYSQAKRDALSSQIATGISAHQAKTNVSNFDRAVRLEVKQLAPKDGKAKCERSLRDLQAKFRAAVARAKPQR